MISGLDENLAATCQTLLGPEGETLGGVLVGDSHQDRLSSLEEATLSKCPPERVAA